MKNKSKFEIPLVIVALLVLSAWLLNMVLNNALVHKFTAFKYSAISFNSVVKTNLDFFSNSKVVYLDEALDAQVIDSFKSPFSDNTCDVKESKIEIGDDNQGYVTLKCDDYLIEHVNANSLNDTEFYEVGKWIKKDVNNSFERKKLYNCKKNGKLLFNDYVEKDYFIYEVNKKTNMDYKSLNEIKKSYCDVESKVFYRSKKEIYDKSK